MAGERNWREAKIPQWVKDSIADELKQWELTAALSWPTEPKPQPVFWGKGYGQVGGAPEAGEFWLMRGAWDPERVLVEVNGYGSAKVKGSHSSISSAQKFYRTEHEARLAGLWEKCLECADELAKLRRGMR